MYWPLDALSHESCSRPSNGNGYTDNWLQSILGLSESAFTQTQQTGANSKLAAKQNGSAEEAALRLRRVQQTVSEYAPWFSPEFAALRDDAALNLKLIDSVGLQQVPHFID